MALYAAYGSNLDPEQMLTRAPHSPAQGTGWLQGWRLTFGGEELSFEGALATVVEDAGSQVFVMLYDVPDEGPDEATVHVLNLFLVSADGSVMRKYNGMSVSPDALASDIKNANARR